MESVIKKRENQSLHQEPFCFELNLPFLFYHLLMPADDLNHVNLVFRFDNPLKEAVLQI